MADRSLRRGRANEPTGEVETLRGRSDIGRMGDRVDAVGASDTPRTRRREFDGENQRKKHKQDREQRPITAAVTTAGKSIVDLDNVTGYEPTTLKSKKAFETLLVS